MIQVQDLTIRNGAFALERVNFTVASGAYAVLMGSTGSGKTSIMEVLCGIRKMHSGRISIMNRNVSELKPAERNIGLVPQDAALFSTMTVRENMGFPLTIRNWKSSKIAQRIDELAALLKVSHLLDRRPLGLSGGEAQRVALGRALSFYPAVLCLDEPLSAIDEETRVEMYDLLRTVQKSTGVTTLHVTHSQAEAKALADACFTIRNGQLQETAR